jgi:hypothetical protein
MSTVNHFKRRGYKYNFIFWILLLAKGIISPGSIFSRELFRGNTFKGIFSRELFRGNSFDGIYFEGTFSQGTSSKGINSQIQPSFHTCDSRNSAAFISKALIRLRPFVLRPSWRTFTVVICDLYLFQPNRT